MEVWIKKAIMKYGEIGNIYYLIIHIYDNKCETIK